MLLELTTNSTRLGQGGPGVYRRQKQATTEGGDGVLCEPHPIRPWIPRLPVSLCHCETTISSPAAISVGKCALPETT